MTIALGSTTNDVIDATSVEDETTTRLDSWWAGIALNAIGLDGYRPMDYVGTPRPWPKPRVNTEQLFWLLQAEQAKAVNMPTEVPTGRRFYTWNSSEHYADRADETLVVKTISRECLVCSRDADAEVHISDSMMGAILAGEAEMGALPDDAHRFIENKLRMMKP